MTDQPAPLRQLVVGEHYIVSLPNGEAKRAQLFGTFVHPDHIECTVEYIDPRFGPCQATVNESALDRTKGEWGEPPPT